MGKQKKSVLSKFCCWMHVLAISLIHLQVRLVVFFRLYDGVICFFVNLKVKIVDYSTKFSTEPMNLNYCKCCKKLNQHLLVLRRMSKSDEKREILPYKGAPQCYREDKHAYLVQFLIVCEK